MTPELTFLGALAGIAAFCVIVAMIRHERDAYLGRKLREAAGDEHHARMAIESANLDRLLRQKYDAETDRAMRRGFRKLNNVVPLRIVDRVARGRPVHFDPPGAA